MEKLYFQPALLPAFFVFLIFLYRWFFKTTQKNAPPSPPKLPIIGNLHQLAGMQPHKSLQSLSKRYGELMLIHLGYKPTLVVSSASVAKEILKTHDAISSSRPRSSMFDKLLYNCKDVVAAPYGEFWRKVKSLCVLQLLSNKRVRTFRAIREEEMALMMEKIKQSCNSEVNLSEMLIRLTNDVICRAGLGRKYSDNLKGGIDFKALLKDLIGLIGTLDIGDVIPWMSWINRFNGFDKKLDKVAKNVDLLFEDILNEHLEKLNCQGNIVESENGERSKDFVDVLLEVQRDNTAGFPLDRDTIKALILDVFTAGTDTTYRTLEWEMTELLNNPNVMKKLQNEVRAVTKSTEHISDEDLEKMPYLKAVFKETLRLHPPLPMMVPHETIQKLNIKGYEIAPKTMVIVNVWAIQRDPANWDEPEKFRPERFLDSPVDFKGQDIQLIPFGSGRRICPGMSFAMATNEFVLANLVKNFNWELPNGNTGETWNASECTGFTLHRRTPLYAVATPHFQK